jgi:hypothetical protein
LDVGRSHNAIDAAARLNLGARKMPSVSAFYRFTQIDGTNQRELSLDVIF